MKQHVDAISVQGAAGSLRTPGSENTAAAVTGWSGARHLSARGNGLQGAEPQACTESEAFSQKDQKYCRCCYRMGHGGDCSAATRLVGAEQISSPQGTAKPQVPPIINISFLQLHQPLWCISSRGRTCDLSESGALLAQMQLQQPSRGAT